MPYYDSHAHLDAPKFAGDVDETVKRAVNKGVARIITIGTGLESSRKVIELAEKQEEIYVSVGLDPHSASKFSGEMPEEFRKLTRHEKVTAVGETGLDYHYMHSPREIQKEVFKKQIQLAMNEGLPLIIHNRESDQDLLKILREEKPQDTVPVVLHSYSASMETAKKALDMGCFFSFSGMITFKKFDWLRDIARTIPMNRILAETDSPYLAPVPYRGKRNEPAFVIETFKMLQKIKKLPENEFLDVMYNNFLRVFRRVKG